MTGVEYDDFLDLEYEPAATELCCGFTIEPAADMSMEAAASRVASESSNVASGGLYAGIIDQLIDALGTDIIVQAGGGVNGHPDGTDAGKGAPTVRRGIDAGRASRDVRRRPRGTGDVARDVGALSRRDNERIGSGR